MMLNCVTFTGADDRTNPAELLEISARYPWVEWGILIGTRQGVPRMPSKKWIERLLILKRKAAHPFNLALHVCGQPLRTIASGRSIVGEGAEDFTGFDRVQLNWHGERQEAIGGAIARAMSEMKREILWEPEVIFQGDEVNAAAGLHVQTKDAGFPISMLFDCSHGAGVLPKSWPNSIPTIKCGYAGGIGPDNVIPQLMLIEQAHLAGASIFPFWVDMETKVRTGDVEDEFDLNKCRGVAARVEDLVLLDV